MQGEIISIKTAQEISALKRENKRLKKELQELKEKAMYKKRKIKTTLKKKRNIMQVSGITYKKVSELDVLSAFGNIEIIGQYWIPKYLIVQQLGTSMYQINKQCKKLMEQGYLRKKQIEPFHDIEYETGIDYGNSLKVWNTEITDKGIDKLK